MKASSVNKFIPIAMDIAIAMDTRQTFRHVSIIVSSKSIISIGSNNGKTHTLARIKGYKSDYVHSELDAFAKIRYKEGKFTLLNFRFSKQSELRNSRPCKYCMPWCISFFTEIWYSTNKGMKKL